MLKNSLKASVALCALMMSAGVATAQSVSQTVENNAAINNSGGTISTGALDVGASAAINTTGALGSISISGVNAPFVTTGLGNLSQTTTNQSTGTITTTGTIQDSVGLAANLGIGASFSISATGAASALSIQGVSNSSSALPLLASGTLTIGSVGQLSVNAGGVSVVGNIIPNNQTTDAITLGIGSSASVAATGAATSVSIGGIGGGTGLLSLPAIGIGAVTQEAQNRGAVTNTGSAYTATTVFGAGSSVSISATGAATSVGILALGNTAFSGAASLGPIKQTASNYAPVVNQPSSATSVSNIDGAGSSVAVSSVGAVASVATSSIGASSPFSSAPTIAGASQNVTNSGAVSNSMVTPYTWGSINTIKGAGASVSVSATGAQAAINSNSIASTGSLAPVVAGATTQNVMNNGMVTNAALIRSPAADVQGTGTSLSSSATGAVAAIGTTSIDSTGGQGLTFAGTLAQTVANTASISNNLGTLTPVAIGSLTGIGTSISVGATGAEATIGTSSIEGAGTFTGANFQDRVTQAATNGGAVANIGRLVVIYSLTGAGASASISASGAVSSISTSSIGANADNAVGPMTFEKSVNQTATNTGAVTSADPSLESYLTVVGSLSGAGTSATISATGAVTAISTTSIGSATSAGFAGPSFSGDLTQTATNNAGVTNGVSAAMPAFYSSYFSTTALSGAGASVSIGSAGAVASISTSLIGLSTSTSFAPITFASTATVRQTAYNGASVNTYGSIFTVLLSGVGTSSSVSTTGAMASLSNSSIGSGSVVNSSLGSASSPTLQQTAVNGFDGTTAAPAAITTSGSIAATYLSGNGASVSVGATGASASVSVSSISDTSLPSFTLLGTIIQTALNRSGGNVSNTGSIKIAGNLAGAGSSASISAVGASTSLSYRSVR